jgi:hypothetical protein
VVLRLGNNPSQKFQCSLRDKQVNTGVALLKHVQNSRRQLLANAAIAPYACHCVAERGSTDDITEHELTSLITDYAKGLHPDLSADQAFSRVFAASSELRKAIAIAKAAPFYAEPVVVGGTDVNPNDPSAAVDAYNQLLGKAAEYRKANPALSEAQAFSAVFQSRENAKLAQLAHQRPMGHPSFPPQ